MYRFRCIEAVGLLVTLLFAAIATSVETEEGMLVENTQPPPLSVLLVAGPYGGHIMPSLALGEELVRRGHNVTLVSAPTNYVLSEVVRRNISLWSIGDTVSAHEAIKRMLGKKNPNEQTLEVIKLSIDFHTQMIKTIDNPTIKSFDIIVGDALFFASLMCFSLKWNVTGVYFLVSLPMSPADLHAWPFPSYRSGYTDNLSFSQRLISSLMTKSSFLFIKTVLDVYALFGGGTMCKKVNIPLSQIMYYAQYHPTIVTTSFGFEFPRAILPLTDYVGPVLSQSQPQLPQDIAEWLEPRGPRSVVYVSMGSMVIITSEQAQMLISGATQANLSVVWSLRKSNQHILQHMTYDSDSVLIVEWAPQVTVLKHPSIHSAILHGGPGGVQEALSCGVPMIIIPFVNDQFDTGVRVQHYHYGEMITLPELATPLVTKTLRRINSMQYRESLEKIQQIYKKDGGVSKAADLVEFYSDVGYDHLVPSYIKYNWNWIEYHNVDVYAVLILSVVLPSYLLYRILRSCCCIKSKKKVE